jgi:hypothetical protein
MDLNSEPKEYTVSVRTNDIHEAIATTGSALYSLVEEAMQVHEAHEAEECEFEEFSRDVLGVLGRHSDQLNRKARPWDTDEGSVDYET